MRSFSGWCWWRGSLRSGGTFNLERRSAPRGQYVSEAAERGGAAIALATHMVAHYMQGEELSEKEAHMDNVIRALSAEQVSALTDIPKSRLVKWDREGFFQPSYAAENRRLPYSRVYSFEDVVELRTLAILRDEHQVPMKELKRVAATFQKETSRPWMTRRLYVFQRKVAFDEPQSGRRRNVTDGQFIEDCIELKSIADDIAAKAAAMKARQPDTVGKVERHKFVMSNSWVIAGTRIPTAAVKAFADEGYSPKQIVREYPDLTEQDVVVALAHERDRRKAA
jgi:uncharacterized protein (DUF433 family)